MDSPLHRTLPVLAAAYIALQPTGAMTFAKSCLYAAAVIAALIAIVRSVRGEGPPIPRPPLAVFGALLAWSGWSAATWFWSGSRDYSLSQIQRELMDSGLLVMAFYVAARDPRGLRTIMGGAIGSLLVLGTIAIVQDATSATSESWDAARLHLGVGPWTTFLVIVAPLLLALVARPPLGPTPRTGVAFACAAFGILLVTARLTDNRMVWIALAAAFATAGLASAWRWRHAFVQSPTRWLVPFGVVIVALGVLFADAARERADRNFPANTTVATTITADPRIPLWEHAMPAIRERTWTGHGFGRLILGDRFVRELRNPLLTHLHNLFLSQWVQSGAIGLALFCTLLVTLAAYYAGCIRAADRRRALVGTIGLAMLVGFVVRNLTDDFLFRSNAKEFWLLHAALVGCAASLAQGRRRGAGTDEPGQRSEAASPRAVAEAAAPPREAVRETP